MHNIDEGITMHTGMLWFDNSQISLAEKIKKAVEYYTKKYGRKPDLCLVNPILIKNDRGLDWKGESITVDDLLVRPYRPVLPGHIWIGIEDKGGPVEKAAEQTS